MMASFLEVDTSKHRGGKASTGRRDVF